MLEQLAFKILAFYSLLLSSQTHEIGSDWSIVKNWVYENGYYVLEADGTALIRKCNQDQSYFIEFPIIIGSLQIVKVDDVIVYPHIIPDNAGILGYLASPVISCHNLKGKQSFYWEVYLLSKASTNNVFFPQYVENRPLK